MTLHNPALKRHFLGSSYKGRRMCVFLSLGGCADTCGSPLFSFSLISLTRVFFSPLTLPLSLSPLFTFLLYPLSRFSGSFLQSSQFFHLSLLFRLSLFFTLRFRSSFSFILISFLFFSFLFFLILYFSSLFFLPF